jgi:leucyl aminopeptidase (aminopeptidase T)
MPTGEPSPPAVARSLLGSALRIRRGEHVAVVTWSHTLPWASACVAEARRLGALPFLVLEDETAFWRSIDLGPTTRRWAPPAPQVLAAIERSDALVYFPGPADRTRLHALPPGQLTPFLGADDRWLRHTTRAKVRGVRCLLGYASDANAERWGVPAATWRSQLIRGIADSDYAAVVRSGRRVAGVLASGRSLRLTATNGTDLSVRLRGRRPWVDDGVVDAEDRRHGRALATSPGGSVIVAVDERSAQGTVVGNRPSFLGSGRVEGAQWEIDGGRLRNYWYTEGSPSFEAEFVHAPRGRDVVGIFALGLNEAIAPSVPQAEDAAVGTVTIAIGGNSLYGGRNPCRYLSWITVGEATVAVDGHPLVDRGNIL